MVIVLDWGRLLVARLPNPGEVRFDGTALHEDVVLILVRGDSAGQPHGAADLRHCMGTGSLGTCNLVDSAGHVERLISGAA